MLAFIREIGKILVKDQCLEDTIAQITDISDW